MIKVSINKNLVYFFFLFNYLSNVSKKYYPLGEYILNRFNKNLSEIEDLKELYKKKIIPNHPYQYCVYAINTNEDLSPKVLALNDGFGPKMYGTYMNNLYPLALQIEKKLKFFDIFEKEFLSQYELICKEIQKDLGKKIEKTIIDAWKIEDEFNFCVFPNVFEVGHSFGVFRENNLYSISSPILTKDGKIEFNSQNLISNVIHEFSHSIFKKKLLSLKKFQENKDLTKGIQVPEILQSMHSTPDIYIEETYIKVISIIIQEELYKDYVPEEEMRIKSAVRLSDLEKKGYTFASFFYDKLKESKNTFETYFDIVKSIQS